MGVEEGARMGGSNSEGQLKLVIIKGFIRKPNTVVP